MMSEAPRMQPRLTLKATELLCDKGDFLIGYPHMLSSIEGCRITTHRLLVFYSSSGQFFLVVMSLNWVSSNYQQRPTQSFHRFQAAVTPPPPDIYSIYIIKWIKDKLLYDATYQIVGSKLVRDQNSPQCHIKEVPLIIALTFVGRMLEAMGIRKCGLRCGALSLFLFSSVPERLDTHRCICRYFNIWNWKEQRLPLYPSRDVFRKSSRDCGLLPCSL